MCGYPRRTAAVGRELALKLLGKKPPEEPSSYRPLCMLDTAGKIFERIIHQRIDAVVDPLLADNQYGFRKGRSTLDAISLVVNTAKEAIAGTRWKGGAKKYCLVAALDIRNAFNSANWDCIMQALDEKNVPAYLRRLVVSYFTDRVLKYDTKNGPKEYDVTGGVPQALFSVHPVEYHVRWSSEIESSKMCQTCSVCR
ncbi:Retrovirus-related Pol polyprotein from type-1 retrotransposable element R1 [Eumeta japonica]|uniref:Retrovirus-related Pol polyprotein from type-1 retrotransposable element R1 n=1 Tax=Eumeta variegata TaxID=151549 RepID=A0A4C1SE84_EUMVA|nr:Retrovirus-related Pol polyprotein from type-1 retrotransposable element R1 [Eumeta japonica]